MGPLPPPCPYRHYPAPRRTALADMRDEVRRARVGLAQKDPEFQAAILLLMVSESGMNVDRLMRWTRLPREFVSRCLRRLTDNGLWIQAHVQFDWIDARAESPHFWLDVGVVLGRKQRRTINGGTPEWAPAGAWTKDFDYASPGSPKRGVHALFHDSTPLDPEQIAAGEKSDSGGDGFLPAVRGPNVSVRTGAVAGLPRTSGAPEIMGADQGVNWLG